MIVENKLTWLLDGVATIDGLKITYAHVENITQDEKDALMQSLNNRKASIENKRTQAADDLRAADIVKCDTALTAIK